MIVFMLLISRHGKTRLNKYYKPFNQKERQSIQKEISTMIIGRSSRLTHFLEWRDYKIVFKRYASLYFAAGIEKEDNELIVLDVIHHFVEILDRYFGNVCELDLIFNFHQAYFILEELIIGGHMMESSKKQVLKMVEQNDANMDQAFFKDEGQSKGQQGEDKKK
ncbi:hypothetical protein FGO68_gene3625 [Halteria grandinella]|uniref:AP complex subunit sigma n=1 Tax=Halteria grandinella TaxID=5974 RepID=A0A8J8SVW3_HALGN|nr:hypothetical protein FGO68_gene3625 [Halteria grandinella]